MKFKIVGISRKTGEYNGKPYDNTYLYCTYEQKDTEGLCVLSVKVKTDVLPEVYLGDEVTLLYDKYGNVALVQLEK